MAFSRRDFLIGCGGSAALSLGARGARAHAEQQAEFHLQPNYREKSPLEAVLRKRTAAFDTFPLEREHDPIAAILSGWSECLRSPKQQRTLGIREVLAEGFRGPSLRTSQVRVRRRNSWLEVSECGFDHPSPLARDAFSEALEMYLRDFSELLTAELQVIGIEDAQENGVVTKVRYELVGSGAGFHREARIGMWQLQWQKTSSGEYRLTEWGATSETRSRSLLQVYEDATIPAFGRNTSYHEQLVHGVDYWRTVLDGASRIDIYGHNGVSVGDTNGDGLDDIYICQPAGLPNRLYRNRGDGTLEDVTDAAGVGILENTACALFADFFNTGHQDLLVVRANGPLLFVNDGTGKFQPRPGVFRFASEPQGTFTGAAAADYDRDGRLDVYFCLYVYYQGADQYKYPTPYYDANNGPPNILMHNNGDGTFDDVTAKAGLNQNNTRYSFCCGWTDINDNGWPDLYVVNDFGRKNLYRNNGDGTFTDVAAAAGVEDVGAGMSVCSFDYDNDGHHDLYVANMWTAAGERITSEDAFRKSTADSTRALFQKHAMGNSLFRNNGSETFENRTAASNTGMGRWSWSSDAWDFDHDGFLDLYVTNGMISGPIREDLNGFFWRQVAGNSPDESKPSRAYEQGWNAVNELIRADYSWSGLERNMFYASNGDGAFADVSGVVGLDFLDDSRSFALADFDGDGRLEVLLKNRNAPQVRLLRNRVTELPPSISFRLRGTKSNRDAIGVLITIETSLGIQTRMLQAGSGFLSQHSKEIFFGLGKARGAIRASIRWPSGLVQSLKDVPAGHRISVEEGSDAFRAERFRNFDATTSPQSQQASESLPDISETWLLSPVPAPDFALGDHTGVARRLSSLRGKLVLLHFSNSVSKQCEEQLAELDRVHRAWESRGLHLLALDFNAGRHDVANSASFPILTAEQDTAAVYDILYRALFDRHRDMPLPTSFLINQAGEVVKIYCGVLNMRHVEQDCAAIPVSRAERIAQALPFRGNAGTFEFGRNHLSLGSTFFQRGYPEQAEAWFKLALKDDPASAEAQYGIGSVYLKRNDLEAARVAFEQATKLNASYPDTKPDAWNNLGLITIRENHVEDAIGHFKESLQLDPDHVVSLQNLGNAYRQERRWDEARSALERALELAPDEPEVNYSLGMVFAQMNDSDRAYRLLQRAIELRPGYPEAMNNLGVLYLRTQRRDEAVAEFEACIRSSPAFDQSYLNLARVYAIEGNREKARATLLDLLKQQPNHAAAQRALEELR